MLYESEIEWPNDLVILSQRLNWLTIPDQIKKKKKTGWTIIDCCVKIRRTLVVNVPVLTPCHRSDYKKTALPKRQRTGASYSPQTGSSKCPNSQDWIPLCLQECLQAFNEHWIKLQKNRDRKSQFAAKVKPSVWQDHMHFIHSLFIVYFTSLTYKKTHFLTLPMTSSLSLALFPTGHTCKSYSWNHSIFSHFLCVTILPSLKSVTYLIPDYDG